MYHEGLLDDSRRCEIRNNIAEEFSETATLAADAGGYGTIEELDIFGANPDEVYFFVESIDVKRCLIDLFSFIASFNLPRRAPHHVSRWSPNYFGHVHELPLSHKRCPLQLT